MLSMAIVLTMVILKNISVLQKIKENENITSSYTVNAKHVYNIYTMLDQRCIDFMQIFLMFPGYCLNICLHI